MRLKIYHHCVILPIAIGTIIFATSCSTTKRVEDGQYLLVRNKVKIVNPAKEVIASDLDGLVKQKPNSRFLGILPLKLWFNSILKKAGEEPVIYDLSMVEESRHQMIRYLNNIGFYDSKIDSSVHYSGKKARRVVYKVQLSEPYRLRNIDLSIPDDSIKEIYLTNRDKSLIKPGDIFNAFQLDAERNRINDLLKDRGYYAFSNDYIYYEADTTVSHRQVDLTLKIKNILVPGTQITGEPVYENHKIYYINNVFVYPDFHSGMKYYENYDTLIKPFYRRDNKHTDKYRFVFTPPLRIKPDIIGRSIFIGTGRKYNLTDASQTFRKLNDFSIYRFVNISFRESEFKSETDPERTYLDCNVNLIRRPLNSYSVEFQGTNSGGDLGIASYLVFQNKNLFRGAEVLSIKVKGALEAQQNTSVEQEDETKLLFFNTSEFGINASILIPRFYAPINEDEFSRYFRPKTIISVGYNYQNRVDYERTILNTDFGYEWSETRFKAHSLTPVTASLIKIDKRPAFDTLISQESQRFQNQYTDHFILGTRYIYTFNNQELKKVENFQFFRMNIETGGNLLNLATNITGQEENPEGYNTIFGIRYSQYAKVDFDFRYYISIDRDNTVALRAFTGLAVPYGNSVDIPYEKGFFGGGANGMRAWPLRFLGPGSYTPSPGKTIERVGDIALEANVEYRFPVFSIIHGALFFDIGNIWLLDENETFPGGRFEFSGFYKELAIDIGIGIRLDLSFFILRFDLAQKFRDPSRTEGDRIVFGSGKGWFSPVLNLGIGYPF